MDFVLFGTGATLTAVFGYGALLVLERLLLRQSVDVRESVEVRESAGVRESAWVRQCLGQPQ